jgi:hypothetical protein
MTMLRRRGTTETAVKSTVPPTAPAVSSSQPVPRSPVTSPRLSAAMKKPLSRRWSGCEFTHESADATKRPAPTPSRVRARKTGRGAGKKMMSMPLTEVKMSPSLMSGTLPIRSLRMPAGRTVRNAPRK